MFGLKQILKLLTGALAVEASFLGLSNSSSQKGSMPASSSQNELNPFRHSSGYLPLSTKLVEMDKTPGLDPAEAIQVEARRNKQKSQAISQLSHQNTAVASGILDPVLNRITDKAGLEERIGVYILQLQAMPSSEARLFAHKKIIEAMVNNQAALGWALASFQLDQEDEYTLAYLMQYFMVDPVLCDYFGNRLQRKKDINLLSTVHAIAIFCEANTIEYPPKVLNFSQLMILYRPGNAIGFIKDVVLSNESALEKVYVAVAGALLEKFFDDHREWLLAKAIDLCMQLHNKKNFDYKQFEQIWGFHFKFAEQFDSFGFELEALDEAGKLITAEGKTALKTYRQQIRTRQKLTKHDWNKFQELWFAAMQNPSEQRIIPLLEFLFSIAHKEEKLIDGVATIILNTKERIQEWGQKLNEIAAEKGLETEKARQLLKKIKPYLNESEVISIKPSIDYFKRGIALIITTVIAVGLFVVKKTWFRKKLEIENNPSRKKNSKHTKPDIISATVISSPPAEDLVKEKRALDKFLNSEIVIAALGSPLAECKTFEKRFEFYFEQLSKSENTVFKRFFEAPLLYIYSVLQYIDNTGTQILKSQIDTITQKLDDIESQIVNYKAYLALKDLLNSKTIADAFGKYPQIFTDSEEKRVEFYLKRIEEMIPFRSSKERKKYLESCSNRKEESEHWEQIGNIKVAFKAIAETLKSANFNPSIIHIEIAKIREISLNISNEVGTVATKKQIQQPQGVNSTAAQLRMPEDDDSFSDNVDKQEVVHESQEDVDTKKLTSNNNKSINLSKQEIPQVHPSLKQVNTTTMLSKKLESAKVEKKVDPTKKAELADDWLRNSLRKFSHECDLLKNALDFSEKPKDSVFFLACVKTITLDDKVLRIIAQYCEFLSIIRACHVLGGMESNLRSTNSKNNFWQLRSQMIHFPWILLNQSTNKYSFHAWGRETLTRFRDTLQPKNEANIIALRAEIFSNTCKTIEFSLNDQELKFIGSNWSDKLIEKILVDFIKNCLQDIRNLSRVILGIWNKDKSILLNSGDMLCHAIIGCMVVLGATFKELKKINYDLYQANRAFAKMFENVRDTAGHIFSDYHLPADDRELAAINIMTFEILSRTKIIEIATEIGQSSIDIVLPNLAEQMVNVRNDSESRLEGMESPPSELHADNTL